MIRRLIEWDEDMHWDYPWWAEVELFIVLFSGLPLGVLWAHLMGWI